MTLLPLFALSVPTTHLCSPSLSGIPLATHNLKVLCKELLLALKASDISLIPEKTPVIQAGLQILAVWRF